MITVFGLLILKFRCSVQTNPFRLNSLACEGSVMIFCSYYKQPQTSGKMYLIWLCLMFDSMVTVELMKHSDIMHETTDKRAEDGFLDFVVNMCKLKCEARSSCENVGYQSLSLVCYTLKKQLDETAECGRFTLIPKRNTNVSMSVNVAFSHNQNKNQQYQERL